ncbi:MAG: N-acetylmuramoyl-L-alanine amidase [Acidiferrobacteraceae bacterium]|nr:N-acetylmuramoyl-L-alanine amidase [Acidiferrobacteraceae bacterium]
MTYIRLCFFVWILFYSAPSWSASSITNISEVDDGEINQIVIHTNGSFKFKTFFLDDPYRLVIDLYGVTIRTDIPRKSKTPMVSTIRFSENPNSQLRIVLDLNMQVEADIQLKKSLASKKHRLIINLKHEPYIVVIDPGHGGKDPGAIGYGGLREKDVVLEISKRLAKLINSQSGMTSILTRDNDHYPSLDERVKIAREAEAKIFISIHADAFKKQDVRGVSIYALSEKGASSEMAALLAERENSADLAGGISLSQQETDVAEVLLDMQLDWKIQESRLLGQELLAQMKGVSVLHNRNVAYAGFVVLKAPAIPSVLIETGYITNSTDARNLQISRYQEHLVAAIFRGIYFYCQSRPGCPIQKANLVHYTVKKGDSLSKIAKSFNSSVNEIKYWNGLTGDRINLNQILVVPKDLSENHY